MLGLWLGPASNSSDILAATMSVVFAIPMLVVGLLAVLSFYLSRNTLRINRIFAQSTRNDGSIVAGDRTELICELQGLRLLPLVRAKIQLTFERGKIPTGIHELKGNQQLNFNLTEPVIFPHRGFWKVHLLQINFQDAFGLWNLVRTYDVKDGSIRVAPPKRETSSLEVVSSSYIAGDTLPLGEKRAGDYYDLKSYSPTDGVSRIAWKIFARSGELITRQPEREVLPDGKTFIYCFAGPKDDQICAELLAYIQKLESFEIDVTVACEACDIHRPAHNFKAAEELLIRSALNSNTELNKESAQHFSDFVALQGNLEPESRVLIFVGESRLLGPTSIEAIMLGIHTLTNKGLSPVIVCRIPKEMSAERLAYTTNKQSIQRFSRLLLIEGEKQNYNTQSSQNQLISLASKNNWTLMTCP